MNLQSARVQRKPNLQKTVLGDVENTFAKAEAEE